MMGITLTGQQTPDGNQRGKRRHASSPERRGSWQDCFCRHGLRGDRSWDLSDGLAQPRSSTRAASTENSDPAPERSRDLVGARVVWEAKRDESTGLRRPRFFRGAADGLGCAKGLRRSDCGCSGDPTSRNDDTAHNYVARFVHVENAMCVVLNRSSIHRHLAHPVSVTILHPNEVQALRSRAHQIRHR